jgi:hypothetical protein|tara:strand:- start:297 stop:3680 length:3384 start_codon:yes stop_codon:yes gene_type:complete
MALNEKQQQFIDMLQNSIDNNTFAPEALNPLQKRAVDKFIKDGLIKSEPLEKIVEKRTKARQDIAKARTVKKDPIAASLGFDESRLPGGDFLLSGRSSAVLAGDLGASLMAVNYFQDNIANSYKAAAAQAGQAGFGEQLKLTKNKRFFFENLANKLPARFKFTGAALRFAGKALDIPQRVANSPLGRAELGVAAAGTVGAGIGSAAYDVANKVMGPRIIEGMLEDLGDLPPQKLEDMDVIDRAVVEAKNAALFNFGAAALTPLLMASGGILNKLFGTTGVTQKTMAQFARDNGYEIPLLAAMKDGPLSGLGQSYFKTIGVFPYISKVMDKRMLSAENVFAKGYLDSNVATIAPVYSHSFLSQKLYNQAVETFKKNAATIEESYQNFFGLSRVAGNPAILKLDNTLKVAEDFLRQYSQSFPDLAKAYQKGMSTSGVEAFSFKDVADLAEFGDPLKQFFGFASGVARTGPITFEQYKGLTMMLNRALEQTGYQTASRSVAGIRAALERDAHGFLKNLNTTELLKNSDVQQNLIRLGGGDPVKIIEKEIAERRARDALNVNEQLTPAMVNEQLTKIQREGVETVTPEMLQEAAAKMAKTPEGKAQLESVINAGSKMHKALKDGNEVFARIMKFYTGKEGTTAMKALRQFDKSLFTQKTLFNIPGAAVLPKDQLFEQIQKSVFASKSPSALMEFRKMIGAQKGFDGYSEAGAKLYKAASAKFLHNAFMRSFKSKPINSGVFGSSRVPFSAPFENGAFRQLETDVRFQEGLDDVYDAFGRTNVKDALSRQGGEITSRLSDDTLEDVTNIRFGPEDYRDFDGETFSRLLGFDRPTRETRAFLEELYGGGIRGAQARGHLEDFVDYAKRLTDIPITNSSSFIQRRLTLGGASSLAGVALGFGGSAVASPLAPILLFATALRAGKILSDPFLLRQINDVLTPKEVEAVLKGGKAFGVNQAGVINPKAYLAGLRTKREAFARFMNKAFGEDDDFKPVDPDNIDFKSITEYLNAQQVQMIKPNYGEDGENLPQRTIVAMYNEEVMPEPNEAQAAEDQNFIQGGIQAIKDFNSTFTVDGEKGKLEIGDQPNQIVSASPTLSSPGVPTNVGQQVNASQFQALFPNDPTGAAIALRGRRV